MVKVCMLTYAFYSYDSRTRREAEMLANRGDEVDVICLKDKVYQTGLLPKTTKLIQIPIGKYRGNSTLMYTANYVAFFLLAFFVMAFQYFARRYDVVQVHTLPDFLVFAALIPKLCGAKITLDVHELMPELYMSKFKVGEKHPIIRILTWVERCSIAFADKALAVHAPHRDALIKHGNPAAKFATLLNLPDPVVFSAANEVHRDADGKFTLMYHGTLAKRHGVEIVLFALTRVHHYIPGLVFSVIGEGDDRDRLIALSKTLGLQSAVRFSNGRVPFEKLPALIKQADVGLVPILYDSFTKYMLPVKMMEYVGLGIPVIATRTETLEVYFDARMVRYFKSADEVELASHIMDLYQNPEKRKRLVTHAQAFNRKYNWESQKKTYYELIDLLA